MERVDLPILDKLDGTGLLYEIFEKIWNINTIQLPVKVQYLLSNVTQQYQRRFL